MEWNKVIYDDCMNEKNGLPTLEDKSIDLAFFDPPYNINTGARKKDLKRLNIRGFDTYKDKIFYNDKIKNYTEWCKKWFQELERVCNKIVFTCGRQAFKNFWLKYKIPNEILIHYKRNCVSFTYSVRFNQYEPILCYGKFRPFEFRENVLNIPIKRDPLQKEMSFIHPNIKSYDLYYKLIKRMNPKSVIDPFLGSGTTIQVCKKLNIPWIGYEINKIYSQDINKRLNSINQTKSGLYHWFK